MKILIAVPCMDQVPAVFAHSLASLNKVGECSVQFNIGSLIYASRNTLAISGMKDGADYIFWLDSDMVFDSNTLKYMVNVMKEHPEVDILTGLYFRRTPPFSPVLFDKLEMHDDITEWTEFETIPTEMFEVGGCGFGCVLARTDIFMDVHAKFGNMFAPIGNTGEDLAFCWRARQCGFHIYCDPAVQLGHVAHTIVNQEFYSTYSLAKSGAGNPPLGG